MKPKLNCILVIDDDEPTNFLSNMLLEESGCATHIQMEESGKSALDFLANAARGGSVETGLFYPEIIFLDINMPAMNGWEFLEEFKELKINHHPDTKIIMLTTSINPDDKIKSEGMPQVAGFENKPLTSEMIERIVKKYFSDCQV